MCKNLNIIFCINFSERDEFSIKCFKIAEKLWKTFAMDSFQFGEYKEIQPTTYNSK